MDFAQKKSLSWICFLTKNKYRIELRHWPDLDACLHADGPEEGDFLEAVDLTQVVDPVVGVQGELEVSLSLLLDLFPE